MATKLEDKDIPNLLDTLRQHLPHSFFVYYPLKNLEKLKGTVWVDEDSKAVVITSKHFTNDSTKFWSAVVVYATEDSHLESIYQDPRVIIPGSWGIFPLGLSENAWTRLKTCFLHHRIPNLLGYNEDESGKEGVVTFYATDVSYDSHLPDEFKERKLKADDNELLARHWFPYKGREDYIKDCITVTESTVCVMNEQKEPVAWALRHIYGGIGMTFVLPGYRNQGLGKYVTAAIARDSIRKDGYCLVCVELDNTASQRMHESIGFVKLEKHYFPRFQRNDS